MPYRGACAAASAWIRFRHVLPPIARQPRRWHAKANRRSAMRINPFYDVWLFLIGETGPQLGIGGWRYLTVAYFWLLVIASIYLARRNWKDDPGQRTEIHLGTWLARTVIGGMWFEGCLWKLPIPSGGFQYWLEQEAQHAAFGFYGAFVSSVLLPLLTPVNIVAFLCE